MANTYLAKTFGSAGTRTKYTISTWVKRANLGVTQCIFSAGTSANYVMGITFNGADDRLYWNSYSNAGASYDYFLDCTRRFRDTSAWYHIVCAFDSTQVTASNRMKIYINGVQETSFVTETYPSQDYAGYAFNNITHEIGQDVGNGSRFFSGSMSHYYGIDGLAYAPTVFGETDATDGMWKIKTSPTVTMGTNGFLILKDGNTITDQSSNSNDWALGGGTLTSTQDNSDNNFATLNPLDNYYFGGTFTNGNTTTASPSSTYAMCTSTLGMSSGKYYVEAKLQAGYPQLKFGITSRIANSTSDNMDYSGSTCFSGTGTLVLDNVTTALWGSTFAVGDIVGCALDMDNLRIYFSINGVWQNSANPSLGTGSETIVSPTGAIDRSRNCYFFSWSDNHASAGSTMEYNFGNGYFGTTAITSAGTNASGNGDFEYDVPTGFTALCTKGLNT